LTPTPSINPAAFLRFARDAAGAPYVYGGTGRPCTPHYRRERMAQYPAQASAIKRACPVLSGKAAGCGGCRYAGRACYDCAQLVRFALKAAELRLPSGATSQWRAGGVWAWQGPISPLAANFPCVLFREEEPGGRARAMAHTGISLGNGWAVDARSHKLGVIHTRLTAYPWTHMAFPLGFPLPGRLGAAAPEPLAPPRPGPPAVKMPLRPLRQGARGEEVLLLQRRLLMLGYHLPVYGADGKYGLETAAALRAFQHTAGLPPTGRADTATLERLFPKPPPFMDPWALFEEEAEDASTID